MDKKNITFAVDNNVDYELLSTLLKEYEQSIDDTMFVLASGANYLSFDKDGKWRLYDDYLNSQKLLSSLEEVELVLKLDTSKPKSKMTFANILNTHFKAKRKDNGEWSFGDLIHLDNRIMIADKSMSAHSNGGLHETISLECVEVIPETVCRYWMNRNGVNFYEGDKVVVQGTKRKGLYETYIVFDGTEFKLNQNQTYYNDDKCCITIKENIGNIHGL